ncbi:MAG: hypothetical protein JWN73_2859 [Betaproteobacteria bacterium]|nr:hypothetical protein [Betaproteobacteria bacterium]
MPDTSSTDLGILAGSQVLAGLLGNLRENHGGYTIVEHWKQGEFHHDLVLRINAPTSELPGDILVVSTNCNGGVKELLCFGQVPDRWALWHHRCPNIPEFEGSLPPILGAARTPNWYDPCGLLGDNGPSELKPEFRERLRGGGWCLANPGKDKQ